MAEVPGAARAEQNGAPARAAEPLRLVLVRHGRSALTAGGWLDTAGYRAWRAAYERASIRTGERVPEHLVRRLDPGARLVASDAPRALASAELLARTIPGLVVVSPLLRELELPPPELGPVRLPVAGWAAAVAARALVGAARGRFPTAAEVARLAAAAAWLDELARTHRSLVVVTHGSFRRELVRRLAKLGWRRDGGARSQRLWSAWRLVRGPAPTASAGGPT